MLLPVVLSGGSGTRLWPLSRKLYPKQFLPLVGESSMLQATIDRVREYPGLGAPIVCNEDHRFFVAEQFRDMGVSVGGILLEPDGRNTAPAVALAALRARITGDDPVLLVMPADHVIVDVSAFHAALEAAVAAAESGALVTFGIVPSSAHTGYGYIRADRTKHQGQSAESITSFPVLEFVEKPDTETAVRYLASGDYFWNSGMFVFRASRYLDELKRFAPRMLALCEAAVEDAREDMDFTRPSAAPFLEISGDSIDYAVMEKTDSAVVVPLDAGWSDVGSWESLWDVNSKDDNGNVTQGDVLLRSVSNSLVRSEGRLVAAVGVDNLVVVETGDAVLVMSRDQDQAVKQVVESLKAIGRSEALLHRRVPRPWGDYECIDMADRFQVKRITVKPGEKLSLQMHHHRAEHWIVVKGTARVTRGDEVMTLAENQSTYIPVGMKHRLENPGVIPLEIIEVQSGGYLGEDDIVRFDDQYGR